MGDRIQSVKKCDAVIRQKANEEKGYAHRGYAALVIPTKGTVKIQAVLPDHSVVDLMDINTYSEINKVSKISLRAKIYPVSKKEPIEVLEDSSEKI